MSSRQSATPAKSASQTPAKTPGDTPNACACGCGSCGKLKIVFGILIVAVLAAIGGGYATGKIELNVAAIAGGAVVGLAVLIAIIGKFACKSKGAKAKPE